MEAFLNIPAFPQNLNKSR